MKGRGKSVPRYWTGSGESAYLGPMSANLAKVLGLLTGDFESPGIVADIDRVGTVLVCSELGHSQGELRTGHLRNSFLGRPDWRIID